MIQVETIGYVGRAISANQSPDWTKGPYIIQSTLLLIAPALFAASIYMELGRVIVLVRAERFAIIRVNWMTKIFVGGDVLSFLMQASGTSPLSPGLPFETKQLRDSVWLGVCISLTDDVGAGLMVTAASGASGSADSAKTGNNVIIGGLFVQIIFFGFFLVSAVVFQRRFSRVQSGRADFQHFDWRKHMFALHTSSVLILIRSVVRVVEYVQGDDGFVMRNEVFIYCFDGLLMWVMMVIFVVVHPGEIKALLKQERMMGRGFGVDGQPLV